MAVVSNLMFDPSKKADGVWRKWVDDIEVKIAHIDKPEIKNAQRKFRQDLRKLQDEQKGKLHDEAAFDALVEQNRQELAPLIAKFVLLDWKNMLADDGSEIPYSVEQATEWLANEDFPQFFTDICNFANEEAYYKRGEMADTEKKFGEK